MDTAMLNRRGTPDMHKSWQATRRHVRVTDRRGKHADVPLVGLPRAADNLGDLLAPTIDIDSATAIAGENASFSMRCAAKASLPSFRIQNLFAITDGDRRHRDTSGFNQRDIGAVQRNSGREHARSANRIDQPIGPPASRFAASFLTNDGIVGKGREQLPADRIFASDVGRRNEVNPSFWGLVVCAVSRSGKLLRNFSRSQCRLGFGSHRYWSSTRFACPA